MSSSLSPVSSKAEPSSASLGESHASGGGPAAAAVTPDRIADRYVVEHELGRGGLAVVYRARDEVTGRTLALKQLALGRKHRSFVEQSAAFEREYHTLAQLSHPRIIEVYDFGSDPSGQYYTMELLDGGDLRELSPLPWRRACALLYDVCSSLSLLHSRALVHRDISPRNIRCTQQNEAKLIDFGALSPMGPTTHCVGTPPFVAPEVVHRSTLDGRTDLFSLGATLYFTLTARLAYPARQVSALQEVWQVRPPPPSAIVADIPPALDALVLSLISLDPAARPRSAFEVMQRLCSVADLQPREEADVAQAYLAAPVIVGREQPLQDLRAALQGALDGRGSGVLMKGPAGIGRTRLLDTCALEGKTAGAAVLRVNTAATRGRGSLGVARALCEQALEAMPEHAVGSAREAALTSALFVTMEGKASRRAQPMLKTPAVDSTERTAFQAALGTWLLRMAAGRPLAILVDDAEHADEASLAVLASLVLSASRAKLLLVATVEQGTEPQDSEAFSVLRRECSALSLSALDREHSQALVLSVFGDVPNAQLVADRMHTAAQGNPRESMELLQLLVSQDAIRYRDGRWVLPARLDATALPSSAAEACERAVTRLSDDARMLAQVQALSLHPTLSRRDYGVAAPELPAARLDAAISQLLAHRVLIGDGRDFSLSRGEWNGALTAELDDAARRDRHRRLARVYGQSEEFALERANHLLAAGDTAGLELLVELLQAAAGNRDGLLSNTTMRAEQVAEVLDRGLERAEAGGCNALGLNEIRRGLVSMAVVTDERHYTRAAPAWFEQLRQDSGLARYETLTEIADPQKRLMQALTETAERYAATPEDERVWSPEAAIRGLGQYTVVSIAVGSRMQDTGLIGSLPAVLEPFAGLSPVLHTVWQNAIATRETICDNRPEAARERWLKVLEALANFSEAELSYGASLRDAIIFGLGSIEARLGLPSIEQTAKMLDDNPLQAVSAMSLRKIARLQHGDFAGAERCRRRAEQLALNANLRSMFSSALQSELVAHALANDLTGIAQAGQAIEPLAARFPGWLGYKYLAAGYLEQARGRFEAALVELERGLAVSHPAPRVTGLCCSAWPRLQSTAIEVLVSLERAQEAKERGADALAACVEHEIEFAAFGIHRAMALAEAKLGDYEGACARLQQVIDQMTSLGVTGLELGATYEARARIGIWFSDEQAVSTYGALTAKEYRYGEGSSLGARYERLMDEAHSRGRVALPQLVDFKTKMTTVFTRTVAAAALVEQTLAAAANAEERALGALRMLCDARSADSGHLYLRTPDGVRRVASLGPSVADDALTTTVAQAFEEVAEEGVDQTATLTAGSVSASAPATTSTWIDDSGIRHLPVPLLVEVGGRTQCAGMAMIAGSDAAAVRHGSAQVVAAVARCLVRAGDAR